MKKFLIAIILMCILLSSNTKTNFSLLDYFNGEYYAYTSSQVSSNSVNLGNCYMNNFKLKDNSILIGESIKIDNLEIGAALKTLNAKLIKTEHLESGAVVIYAYSPKILTSVRVGSNKVNLQIANYDEYSIIGWPLILGSF